MTVKLNIKNKPEIAYIEDNCYRWTFQAKKVKKAVEENCFGQVLNLFAGKTRLSIPEVRVDMSDEHNPDYHMKAGDFLKYAIEEGMKFDTIIYDPPWNERKAREKYNGNFIGKFTKLKDDIVEVLTDRGIIISVGYEISNFGKKRYFEIKKLYVVNSFGDINPYFISIEQRVYIPKLLSYFNTHVEKCSVEERV